MTQLVSGAWHKLVAVEEAPLLVTEGDGLESLRKIRQRYYNTATQLVRRHTDEETGQLPAKYHSIVAWYRTQGDRVNLLIPEDKEYLDVNLSQPSNFILLGTVAVVDEAGNVEHVPVEAVQADSQVAGEDVARPEAGGIGYSTDYASGSSQAGLGEVTVEEPAAVLPGTSETPVDSGTQES